MALIDKFFRRAFESTPPWTDYYVLNHYYDTNNCIGEHSDADDHWGDVAGDTVIITYTYEQAGILIVKPATSKDHAKDLTLWKYLVDRVFSWTSTARAKDKINAVLTNQCVNSILCPPNSALIMGGFFQGQLTHQTMSHAEIMELAELVRTNDDANIAAIAGLRNNAVTAQTLFLNSPGWRQTLANYVALQQCEFTGRTVFTLRHVLNHDRFCTYSTQLVQSLEDIAARITSNLSTTPGLPFGASPSMQSLGRTPQLQPTEQQLQQSTATQQPPAIQPPAMQPLPPSDSGSSQLPSQPQLDRTRQQQPSTSAGSSSHQQQPSHQSDHHSQHDIIKLDQRPPLPLAPQMKPPSKNQTPPTDQTPPRDQTPPKRRRVDCAMDAESRAESSEGVHDDYVGDDTSSSAESSKSVRDETAEVANDGKGANNATQPHMELMRDVATLIGRFVVAVTNVTTSLACFSEISRAAFILRDRLNTLISENIDDVDSLPPEVLTSIIQFITAKISAEASPAVTLSDTAATVLVASDENVVNGRSKSKLGPFRVVMQASDFLNLLSTASTTTVQFMSNELAGCVDKSSCPSEILRIDRSLLRSTPDDPYRWRLLKADGLSEFEFSNDIALTHNAYYILALEMLNPTTGTQCTRHAFQVCLLQDWPRRIAGFKTAIQTMIDYNFSMYTTGNLDVLTPWPIVSSSNMPLAVGNLIPPHIE